MAGLYIVRRDLWYTERATWGIAGMVVLAGTVGALWVAPWLAVLILCTGVFSLVVAFRGYCVIGTLLKSLGMPSLLAEEVPPLGRLQVYRMKRDTWYLERGIYAVVGTTLSLGATLSYVHSPWWLAFTGFVGLASLAFSSTGFCPVANVLYWLGFEPRLGPTAVESQRSTACRDAAA